MASLNNDGSLDDQHHPVEENAAASNSGQEKSSVQSSEAEDSQDSSSSEDNGYTDGSYCSGIRRLHLSKETFRASKNSKKSDTKSKVSQASKSKKSLGVSKASNMLIPTKESNTSKAFSASISMKVMRSSKIPKSSKVPATSETASASKSAKSSRVREMEGQRDDVTSGISDLQDDGGGGMRALKYNLIAKTAQPGAIRIQYYAPDGNVRLMKREAYEILMPFFDEESGPAPIIEMEDLTWFEEYVTLWLSYKDRPFETALERQHKLTKYPLSVLLCLHFAFNNDRLDGLRKVAERYGLEDSEDCPIRAHLEYFTKHRPSRKPLKKAKGYESYTVIMQDGAEQEVRQSAAMRLIGYITFNVDYWQFEANITLQELDDYIAPVVILWDRFFRVVARQKHVEAQKRYQTRVNVILEDIWAKDKGKLMLDLALRSVEAESYQPDRFMENLFHNIMLFSIVGFYMGKIGRVTRDLVMEDLRNFKDPMQRKNNVWRALK